MLSRHQQRIIARQLLIMICVFKPLDEKILKKLLPFFLYYYSIEDGVRNGGLGSTVTEWMNDHGYLIPITRMGLPDNFVEHGTVQN